MNPLRAQRGLGWTSLAGVWRGWDCRRLSAQRLRSRLAVGSDEFIKGMKRLVFAIGCECPRKRALRRRAGFGADGGTWRCRNDTERSESGRRRHGLRGCGRRRMTVYSLARKRCQFTRILQMLHLRKQSIRVSGRRKGAMYMNMNRLLYSLLAVFTGFPLFYATSNEPVVTNDTDFALIIYAGKVQETDKEYSVECQIGIINISSNTIAVQSRPPVFWWMWTSGNLRSITHVGSLHFGMDSAAYFLLNPGTHGVTNFCFRMARDNYQSARLFGRDTIRLKKERSLSDYRNGSFIFTCSGRTYNGSIGEYHIGSVVKGSDLLDCDELKGVKQYLFSGSRPKLDIFTNMAVVFDGYFVLSPDERKKMEPVGCDEPDCLVIEKPGL